MNDVFEDGGEQKVVDILRPVRMYMLRNPDLTSAAKRSA